MKKTAVIPIDNRPITYTLLEEITSLNKNLKLYLPKRELLGGLTSSSNSEEIIKWLKELKDIDSVIISLDTLAYGGLVASRRTNEDEQNILKRLETLSDVLESHKANGVKIFAHSSIMRISNNNINEEEKEYWNLWGKKIYELSYLCHKSDLFAFDIKTDIPKEILTDYLQTRTRNFKINKLYLDWAQDGLLDYLVFSKDDTGKFGFNVLEGEVLQSEIKTRNINATVKTGLDEIPLLLYLKSLIEDKIKIKIEYSYPDSVDKISRYEDISVKKCIESQIEIGLNRAVITEINPDIILYVNNFSDIQGDYIFKDRINENKISLNFDTDYIVADINNANGADRGLIENIIQKKDNKLLSYSGYNTSANSIGSALTIGIITYFAKKEGVLDEINRDKLLAKRFIDDWAYQTDVRKYVEENKTLETAAFKPYEEAINKYFNRNFLFSYNLPWNRSFEIEANIKQEDKK